MINYHKTATIDTETTGLPFEIVPGKKPGTTRKRQFDYKTEYSKFPHIVSIAWKIDDMPTKHFIINQQGREIPKEASDIHGITTEIANKSEDFISNVIISFVDELRHSDIIVGHNLYFDILVVKGNILREIETGIFNKNLFDDVEHILHKDRRIDTMRNAIKFFGKWPTLEELHNRLLGYDFPAHNAMEDVEATYRVYLKMIDMGLVPIWEDLQKKKDKS